jgi:hypothetical protein
MTDETSSTDSTGRVAPRRVEGSNFGREVKLTTEAKQNLWEFTNGWTNPTYEPHVYKNAETGKISVFSDMGSQA